MAKVLEEVEVAIEWEDLNRRIYAIKQPPALRPGGVHVSAILRYVAIELKMLESGQVNEEDVLDPRTMQARLRMLMGQAWEDRAVELWPDMQHQPGYLQRDGVTGTPDARRWLGDGRVCIPDFKLTWKGAVHVGGRVRDILKEWMWISQLKSYLAMDTRVGSSTLRDIQFPLGELHVGYVGGAWNGPTYKRYLIEFERIEIERFWENIILKYKDRVEGE